MPNKYGVGTTENRINGDVVVTYWDTQVVVIKSDGSVVLNSGDWLTQTTKKRMNQVSWDHDLGFQVYQKKGKWFVSFQGEELPFIDGMVLNVS